MSQVRKADSYQKHSLEMTRIVIPDTLVLFLILFLSLSLILYRSGRSGSRSQSFR